jgi:hypothetical protein
MQKPTPTLPSSVATAPLPRLAVSAEDAASMIGVGRSLLLQLDKTGELGPRFHRLGARKVLAVDELRAWLAHGCPARPEWVEIWDGIVKRNSTGGEGGF